MGFRLGKFPLGCLLGLLGMTGQALELPLVWPTPNRAFLEGKAPDAFLQPTASGRLESALWGCVRNGGTKFHEGLDLKPVKRSANGEAADPVFAIMPGTVVHVSSTAGRSSYGRYIVIEHSVENLKFYSLYAHLARIRDGIQPGVRVLAGAELATMGRSAAGYTIPRHRAHLHLEIGMQLSGTGFDRWYGSAGFGSRNYHGPWNGMNLVGFDPLDFYRKVVEGLAIGVFDYLRLEPVAVEVRYHTDAFPDFLRRNPGLIEGRPSRGQQVAWDIGFTNYGLPVRWTPRFRDEIEEGKPSGTLEILKINAEAARETQCRKVLERVGSGYRAGANLRRYMAILFS